MKSNSISMGLSEAQLRGRAAGASELAAALAVSKAADAVAFAFAASPPSYFSKGAPRRTPLLSPTVGERRCRRSDWILRSFFPPLPLPLRLECSRAAFSFTAVVLKEGSTARRFRPWSSTRCARSRTRSTTYSSHPILILQREKADEIC